MCRCKKIDFKIPEKMSYHKILSRISFESFKILKTMEIAILFS